MLSFWFRALGFLGRGLGAGVCSAYRLWGQSSGLEFGIQDSSIRVYVDPKEQTLFRAAYF